MCYSAKVGQKNHCRRKAEFLKSYEVSHYFLMIESVFFDHHFVKARFVPSPNALFCTTLGTKRGDVRFWWFFDFLHPFSLFSDFGVSGTNVSLALEKRTSVKKLHRKGHFSLRGLLGPLLENYAFGIRNTHIRCSEPFFFTFLLMSFLTEIMSFTSVGIRFLIKSSQNLLEKWHWNHESRS